MKLRYSSLAKTQLLNIKEYISKDNKKRAITHLQKIKEKIELLKSFPYLGKINTIKNKKNIRDYIILGYKIIYKINTNNILILAIYKRIDFKEEEL